MEKYTGYAIQIAVSNDNTEVEAIASTLRSSGEFSDFPIRVDTEIPYFKLRIGAFIDRYNANRILQQVISEYPDAMIVNRNVQLSQVSR